ncbi:MAG: patatin family protein [Clostridia bacterium]|nr:patatin family protein [Clostridia bacterium]
MLGYVDVGGGERGAYGAGVLDACLESGITFDYFAGVSAGAANIVSFLAGQKGRNYRFYTEYSFRSRYMGLQALMHSGSYFDLEYIYGELSNSGGEDPLDYPAMSASGKRGCIVATDAGTGLPVYFDLRVMRQDDYGAVKASSCIPVLARAYRWRGRKLYDGGISDPIPFAKCFEQGCDRVVVVLTRPKDARRDPKKDAGFARLLSVTHPAAAKALKARAQTYNRELEEALRLEEEGKILIVAPADIGGMQTLTRDPEAIRRMYRAGCEDGRAIRPFLETA